MASYRDTVIEKLKTEFSEITELKTVERKIVEPENQRYLVSELPALIILEPAETYEEYEKANYAIFNLTLDLVLWAVSEDGNTTSEIDTCIKKIKEKLHSNLTLDDTSLDVEITSISSDIKTKPLFKYTISIVVSYYHSILTA